jgi:hypothetical protein
MQSHLVTSGLTNSQKKDFEEILRISAADADCAAPDIIWRSSPVDAFMDATLMALEMEMRAAFEEEGELEVDFADFELAMDALKSFSQVSDRDKASIRLGLNGIFSLGGLYAREAERTILTDWILSNLKIAQDTEPATNHAKTEEAFRLNCNCLEKYIKVSVTERILKFVSQVDTDVLSLWEQVEDGLQETWWDLGPDRKLGALGPRDLLHPALEELPCPWWIFSYENHVWVAGGPSSIHTDKSGYLHSSNGPAASFVKNQDLYAWHGDLVPKHWIEGSVHSSMLSDIEKLNISYRAIDYPHSISVLSEIIDERERDR